MSLTYGFYNSIQHDRKYNAVQMSQIFDGIINDGIYMGFMDHFAVTPGTGMKVIIGAGRAWFNHTWTYNDSAMIVEIDEASTGLNRIDLICLAVDVADEVRANSIELIKGTPVGSPTPEKPEAIDTDTKFYHPLAYVTVSASTTHITAAMIENCIGVNPRTPFVTGIIETIDATELVNQWGEEWDAYKIEKRTDYEAWIAKQQRDMTAWEANFQNSSEVWFRDWSRNRNAEFTQWFNRMKGQLSTDAAGHLQNEIDQLISDMFDSENDMHNKNIEFFNNSEGDTERILETNLDTGATKETTFGVDEEGHDLVFVYVEFNNRWWRKTITIYETIIDQSVESGGL